MGYWGALWGHLGGIYGVGGGSGGDLWGQIRPPPRPPPPGGLARPVLAGGYLIISHLLAINGLLGVIRGCYLVVMGSFGGGLGGIYGVKSVTLHDPHPAAWPDLSSQVGA